MHEMGIMSAMLRSIDQILEAEENVSHVEKIVMQIGETSGVVPKYIEDCYKAVAYGTSYENTVLEIEVIPGIVVCKDCGEQFNAVVHDLKCPQCGKEQLTPLSGCELMIKEIVIC